MKVTAIPHRWYASERESAACMVIFQAWEDNGEYTLIGYLRRGLSVSGAVVTTSMVSAREWRKLVKKDDLVLQPSDWEPSWFRSALMNSREFRPKPPRVEREAVVTPKVILRKSKPGFTSLFEEE